MSLRAPIFDPHDRTRLLDSLQQMLPGYLPNWLPADTTSGVTLMRIFARYLEILADGVNQVPDRSLLAFLDTLETHLLPAQAAAAPLVFTLLENAAVDVTLSAGSQIAARAALTLPSLVKAEPGQPAPTDVLFSTRQTVTLTRANLAVLYSIDPGSDEYADHTADLTTGFTLFDRLQRTEHAIYLGHDDLFALGGENIMVMLSFSLERFASRELKTQWEYLTEGGWSPLLSTPQDDTTNGLRHDGLISLRRDYGPKAKQATIEGHTSYWLRGRLTTPLLPDGPRGERTVPVINDIRARVGFIRKELAPEAAFMDGVPLDISKDFYPFGQQPTTYTTFYLACKEVFQRRGARVRMDVILSQLGTPKPDGNNAFELKWEFFDGVGWNSSIQSSIGSTFTFNSMPDPTDLTKPAILSFECPRSWQETSVNGKNNYWLRVRIVKGDYGQLPNSLTPPVIAKITLAFTYLTDPFELDHCLSNNDFVYEDHTEDVRWPDRTFTPFRPVADAQPTVHFGFDRRLPTGLISLYVDVQQETDDTPRNSPFRWDYLSTRGWSELGVLDETLGFRHSGMIQFIGQPDATAALGLGGERFRVRARLKPGEAMPPLPIASLWLNALWADQRTAPQPEEVGITDGKPNQSFTLQRKPVLEGETLEVQEWRGRGDRWQTTLPAIAETDLRFERDPATDEVMAVWVRWYGQPHLYSSQAGDRHYTLERATGLLRFGDGRHGLLPPVACRVRVTYSSGGGISGNVAADTISELRTALPFIQAVTNPIPAAGGAPLESTDAVKRRGPQRLRHRDRAVAAEDYEWLAREAAPDVARVRCLPITGAIGHAQRGWITLVVAPASADPQPQPAPEFCRRVRDFLAARVPATVSRQVRVVGPQYTPVSVYAELVPHTAGEAAQVEAQVRARLNRFLHPLTGGQDGQGWTFGQTVYLSQIAWVIEETPGVDYARTIRLSVNDQIFADAVAIDAYTLPAAGNHELKLSLGVD